MLLLYNLFCLPLFLSCVLCHCPHHSPNILIVTAWNSKYPNCIVTYTLYFAFCSQYFETELPLCCYEKVLDFMIKNTRFTKKHQITKKIFHTVKVPRKCVAMLTIDIMQPIPNQRQRKQQQRLCLFVQVTETLNR